MEWFSPLPDPRLHGEDPVLILDENQLLYSVPDVMPARQEFLISHEPEPP